MSTKVDTSNTIEFSLEAGESISGDFDIVFDFSDQINQGKGQQGITVYDSLYSDVRGSGTQPRVRAADGTLVYLGRRTRNKPANYVQVQGADSYDLPDPSCDFEIDFIIAAGPNGEGTTASYTKSGRKVTFSTKVWGFVRVGGYQQEGWHYSYTPRVVVSLGGSAVYYGTVMAFKFDKFITIDPVPAELANKDGLDDMYEVYRKESSYLATSLGPYEKPANWPASRAYSTSSDVLPPVHAVEITRVHEVGEVARRSAILYTRTVSWSKFAPFRSDPYYSPTTSYVAGEGLSRLKADNFESYLSVMDQLASKGIQLGGA